MCGPRLPLWFNFSFHLFLNSSSATLSSCQIHAPLKAFVLVLPFPWTALCPNYHLSWSLISENLSSNITSSEKTHTHTHTVYFLCFTLPYFLEHKMLLKIMWFLLIISFSITRVKLHEETTLFCSPRYLQCLEQWWLAHRIGLGRKLPLKTTGIHSDNNYYPIANKFWKEKKVSREGWILGGKNQE